MDVIDTMTQQKSNLQNVVPDRRILVLSLIGSQNYWLDNENSDVDTVAWVTPTFDDIYDTKEAYSKTQTFSGGEIKVRDFRKGIDLLLKQNPADLEMLFTDSVIVNSDSEFMSCWEVLREWRERIARLNKIRFAQSVYGQAYQAYKQAFFNNKSGKYVEYNPKALSNILRFHDMLFSYANRAPFAECLIAEPLTKNVKFENVTFDFETADKIAQEKLQSMLKIREDIEDKSPPIDDEAVSVLHDIKKTLTASVLKDMLKKP